MTKELIKFTLGEIARETESVKKICETFGIDRAATSSDTIYGIAAGYILGRLDQIVQSEDGADSAELTLELGKLLEEIGYIEEFSKMLNVKPNDSPAVITGYAGNALKRLSK